MPLFKQWTEKGASWGIWKVTESFQELRSQLNESCVDVELDQMKSPSRKMEYLAVRVLLKALTGTEHRILHRQSGKPYLADSSCFFTVSHTKGYVAIGLHPQKEVGIDIEQVAERVRKVTSRFVREDELPEWQQHSPSRQLYELLLVWSAKETLFKIMNASAVDFVEHLRIHPFQLHEEGMLQGREYRTDDRRAYAVNYLTHPDFVCTYVVE